MLAPEDLYRLTFVEDAQAAPSARIAYVAVSLEPDAPRPRIFMHDGTVDRFFTEGSAPRWSPDGTRLAFLRAARLYVSPADRAAPTRVTDIESGPAAWSPDGQRLLFATHEAPPDRTMPRVRRALWQKADGQGLLRPSHVCVATLDGRFTQLSEGFDITPAWSPDGQRIAFARMRAEGHSLSDIFVCASDGSGLVQLSHDVTRARCPAWSPDGRHIAFYGVDSSPEWFGDPMLGLWIVPADGSAPPRKLDLAGRAVGYMPPQYVESGPQWDASSLIVPLTDRGSIHLASVDTTSGNVRMRVEGERQVSSYHVAAGRLVTVRGDATTPGDVYLDERRLTDVNGGAQMPPVVRRTFTTGNGEVDGWLYGPAEAGGRRPLLVDVHGGPHSFTGNAFSYGHFYRYIMAARGWLVLALNPTGSGSYGAAFASGIRGQWGEHDLPEHLAAIDALVADQTVDEGRLAITGYSYGGYMTCWAITHTPRFKAAIAGGAVTNLESFYGTSDIGPWFGPYEMDGDFIEARERFRRASPIQYVEAVTTPLLLLHGEADDRCPLGQSEEFYSAVRARGTVACELVTYPEASHLLPYRGRPSFRVDYARRLVAWLERYVEA